MTGRSAVGETIRAESRDRSVRYPSATDRYSNLGDEVKKIAIAPCCKSENRFCNGTVSVLGLLPLAAPDILKRDEKSLRQFPPHVIHSKKIE